MLTVCPHCRTRFRISAAQLKAAEGQVRCGKCEEVFDAYAALDDGAKDLESVSTEPVPPTLELDAPMAAVAEPPLEAPTLKAGPRKGKLPPIDDMFGDHGMLSPLAPEDRATPELPGEQRKLRTPLQGSKQGFERAHQDDAPRAASEAGMRSDAVGAGLYAEQDAKQKVPDVTLPPETHIAPGVEFSISMDEDLHLPPKAPPQRARSSALWWLGILVMLVVLGLQLVNASRESLAQNPVLGPSLMALYSALGRPLPPPRSVSGWDVSGLNVTSDPQVPGVLSITGALQDQAAFVQPWPLMRVELTDRYGQTLRSRDFKPAEYLAAGQAGVPLATGQATRFRIDIADPGPDAVGFTLAACLDLPAGRVCSASEHD